MPADYPVDGQVSTCARADDLRHTFQLKDSGAMRYRQKPYFSPYFSYKTTSVATDAPESQPYYLIRH